MLGPNVDGIYPRCVWCGREVYALAVLAYSAGRVRCGWPDCRGWVPADYRLSEGSEGGA